MRCRETIFFPDCDAAFGGMFRCELERETSHQIHKTTDAGYDDKFVVAHDRAPYSEDDRGKAHKVLRFEIQWKCD